MLWRHGRTEWNATGRFQGQLDPPLDEVGCEQVVPAAAVLAHMSPARIITSDLERTTATADVLADLAGLKAERDPRLREVHLGRWQGLNRAEVSAQFPEEYAAWLAGDDVRRSGGETYAEAGERGAAAVLAAVDDCDEHHPLVAVTHGGTARATMGVLFALDPASWWRLGPLGNCRWSELQSTPAGWRLLEHNAGVQDAALVVAERPGDDSR